MSVFINLEKASYFAKSAGWNVTRYIFSDLEPSGFGPARPRSDLLSILNTRRLEYLVVLIC